MKFFDISCKMLGFVTQYGDIGKFHEIHHLVLNRFMNKSDLYLRNSLLEFFLEENPSPYNILFELSQIGLIAPNNHLGLKYRDETIHLRFVKIATRPLRQSYWKRIIPTLDRTRLIFVLTYHLYDYRYSIKEIEAILNSDL